MMDKETHFTLCDDIFGFDVSNTILSYILPFWYDLYVSREVDPQDFHEGFVQDVKYEASLDNFLKVCKGECVHLEKQMYNTLKNDHDSETLLKIMARAAIYTQNKKTLNFLKKFKYQFRMHMLEGACESNNVSYLKSALHGSLNNEYKSGLIDYENLVKISVLNNALDSVKFIVENKLFKITKLFLSDICRNEIKDNNEAFYYICKFMNISDLSSMVLYRRVYSRYIISPHSIVYKTSAMQSIAVYLERIGKLNKLHEFCIYENYISRIPGSYYLRKHFPKIFTMSERFYEKTNEIEKTKNICLKSMTYVNSEGKLVWRD